MIPHRHLRGEPMADNPMGEPQVAAALGKLVSYAPGIGGAILSMAFTEGMKPWEKAVGVAVGLAMAFWVAPGALIFLGHWWPREVSQPQVISMAGAMFGLLGMTGATALKRIVTTLRIQFALGPLKINQDDGGAP